jgi:DNA-directed RNA polymerase specialized sigma subunit
MNGTVAIANKMKEQTRQIEEYVRLFSSNHGRKPLKEEICLALCSKLDDDFLTKYLAKYGSDSINLEIDEQDDSMV